MPRLEGMPRGYIYILVNAAMPGFLKIGKTQRSTQQRASELSSVSGVPSPFIVAYECEVLDCDEVERLIHMSFAKHRVNDDREFFSLPLKDALEVVTQVVGRFDARYFRKQSIGETLTEVQLLLSKSNSHQTR